MSEWGRVTLTLSAPDASALPISIHSIRRTEQVRVIRELVRGDTDAVGRCYIATTIHTYVTRTPNIMAVVVG